MSRVSPMQTSTNGGELSPFMLGRPDHDMWAISLAEMVGYAPRPQGPAEACPGFEFIDTAPGPCRLLPFEPYVTQGYVVEASALLFRFYTNDVLLDDGGGPVEVVSPYSYAQVQALDWEQSNDVMYLFHGEVQTRLLERTAADAFALSAIEYLNGPFLDRNDDETLALSFSGVTGTVTVTATDPLFAATDVGRLIEIEAHDLSDVPSWEPGITTTLGALLQWDGRVYQVVGGPATKRTGSVAPVHTRGVEWDGIGSGQDLNANDAGGVELAYMHDMFGRVLITDYTSATEVEAEVTRTLPLQAAAVGAGSQIGNYVPSWYAPEAAYPETDNWATPGSGSYTPGTWRWRLGAFSDTTGWPEHGVIWNQRLILAKGDKLYGSVAGDLLNFDRLNELGDVSVDMAFALQIDNPNDIRWLHASDELFVGSAVAEYVLRPASAAQPFGPGNIKLARQTRQGSKAIRPVDSDGRPIFVQRNEAKLLELIEGTYGRFEFEDLTRYADHIGNSPLVEMCWQRQPLDLLWAVREDGVLVCADYVAKEQVLGWWRRPLATGLSAKSICAITSPDGRRDQLWCAAEIGGDWLVMLLAPWRLPDTLDETPIMLDAALTYSGAAASVLTAPHLAGKTVEVVGDGIWLGEFEADGSGDVDISATDLAVTEAVLGLAFDAYMVPLPPEAGGDLGPAQGRMKRVSRVTVRVQHSLGLKITCQGGQATMLGQTTPGTDLTAALPLVSKDIPVDVVGAWDRAGQFRIDRVGPFPQTVLGWMYQMEVSPR